MMAIRNRLIKSWVSRTETCFPSIGTRWPTMPWRAPDRCPNKTTAFSRTRNFQFFIRKCHWHCKQVIHSRSKEEKKSNSAFCRYLNLNVNFLCLQRSDRKQRLVRSAIRDALVATLRATIVSTPLKIRPLAPTAFPNEWMQPLLLSSDANFRLNNNSNSNSWQHAEKLLV